MALLSNVNTNELLCSGVTEIILNNVRKGEREKRYRWIVITLPTARKVDNHRDIYDLDLDH